MIRRLPLGGAAGPGQRGIDDQRLGVLRQQVAHVAQPAQLAVARAEHNDSGRGHWSKLDESLNGSTDGAESGFLAGADAPQGAMLNRAIPCG